MPIKNYGKIIKDLKKKELHYLEADKSKAIVIWN